MPRLVAGRGIAIIRSRFSPGRASSGQDGKTTMNTTSARTRTAISTTLALGLAALAAMAILSWTGQARAEGSSWLYVGSGPGLLSRDGGKAKLAPTLRLDLGMGTTPAHLLVLGGLVRTSTYMTYGTDLEFAARGATSGFAVGDWGLALDAGLSCRWWGNTVYAPSVSAHVGAPFGLQLSVSGQIGAEQDRSLQVLIGIDLLRLTVHRTSGESWWKNPRPAWQSPSQPPSQ